MWRAIIVRARLSRRFFRPMWRRLQVGRRGHLV